MNVTVVEGNLLDQTVEVIVNAWNRNLIPWWLLLPQGVILNEEKDRVGVACSSFHPRSFAPLSRNRQVAGQYSDRSRRHSLALLS